jgi:hypothetical protein
MAASGGERAEAVVTATAQCPGKKELLGLDYYQICDVALLLCLNYTMLL